MAEETLWRRCADSSEFTEPRVLIRVFLEPGELETAIDFYQRLQGTQADARFTWGNLQLAVVGAFLLLQGSASDLEPFRSTTGTLLVDDVWPYHDHLVAEGAEIIFGPRQVTTGVAFYARLPDGTVVEYVHHRPTPDGR